jgi:predicted  nucleic acid-binding Zn-ribbon protein
LKEQLDLLRRLQKVDLEYDEKQGAIEQIRREIQDGKLILEKLATDLVGQRTELEETIALKSDREEELVAMAEAANRSKERLMNVSSTKEYNALEKEIETLTRKSEETREQLDHLREAIDVNQASIVDKESKIGALREQIESAEEEAEGELATLSKKIDATKSRRDKARKGVKPHILRRYDFIRKRRGGTAICAAVKGACQGCFMMLPPQEFIVLQRGQDMVNCPSCQRVLFYSEPDGAEATASA